MTFRRPAEVLDCSLCKARTHRAFDKSAQTGEEVPWLLASAGLERVPLPRCARWSTERPTERSLCSSHLKSCGYRIPAFEIGSPGQRAGALTTLDGSGAAIGTTGFGAVASGVAGLQRCGLRSGCLRRCGLRSGCLRRCGLRSGCLRRCCLSADAGVCVGSLQMAAGTGAARAKSATPFNIFHLKADPPFEPFNWL